MGGLGHDTAEMIAQGTGRSTDKLAAKMPMYESGHVPVAHMINSGRTVPPRPTRSPFYSATRGLRVIATTQTSA